MHTVYPLLIASYCYSWNCLLISYTLNECALWVMSNESYQIALIASATESIWWKMNDDHTTDRRQETIWKVYGWVMWMWMYECSPSSARYREISYLQYPFLMRQRRVDSTHSPSRIEVNCMAATKDWEYDAHLLYEQDMHRHQDTAQCNIFTDSLANSGSFPTKRIHATFFLLNRYPHTQREREGEDTHTYRERTQTHTHTQKKQEWVSVLQNKEYNIFRISILVERQYTTHETNTTHLLIWLIRNVGFSKDPRVQAPGECCCANKHQNDSQ